MRKKEALALFYKKNKISPQKVSNKRGGDYDRHLANLPEKVDQWLADIAKEDRGTFLEVLSRYTYLTEVECQLRYCRVVELLAEKLQELNRTFDDVLIITVESTNGVKSGGDNVRSDFYKRNSEEIPKEQIIAALSKVEEEKINQYSVFVFLDDMIGSSLTLKGVIQRFCDEHKEIVERSNLFYSCIAPRRRGIKHLRDDLKRIKLNVEPIFEEGWIIDPAFEKNSPAYRKMEQYEEKIGNFFDEDGKSYFMGFSKNRITLSLHYNTPNNTLSSFWREIPEQHKALFKRDGNQPSVKRPGISEMKAKSQKLKEAAYQAGQARREKDEGTELWTN